MADRRDAELKQVLACKVDEFCVEPVVTNRLIF
jgi:hypothetical protein